MDEVLEKLEEVAGEDSNFTTSQKALADYLIDWITEDK